jgi:hypothetical protein
MVNATSSLTSDFAVLGFGGAQKQLEEIRIPVSETYGAPAGSSFIALNEWCKTSILCRDEYARRIIAFSVSDRVLDTDTGGNYTTRIRLELVYRVFMTREIKRSRVMSGDRHAELQLNAKKPTQPTVSQNSDTVRDFAAANASVADSAAIGLDQTFQRPLVFGYRAITVDLPAAKSEKRAP